MRELIGKVPTKDPNITEVVYRTEIVRCLACQQTVPMGIEVVTVQKSGEYKKVLRHVCYCRGHGFDYETKAHSLPIRPHAQSQTSFLRFNQFDPAGSCQAQSFDCRVLLILRLSIFLSDAAAKPLRATLPLFASGLGGLGLLGWRQKRKKSAVLAI